jgi:hypothetical protein
VDDVVSSTDGVRLLWGWCGGASPTSLHPWDQLVSGLARDDTTISRMVQRSPAGRRRAGDVETVLVDRRQRFDEIADIVLTSAARSPRVIVLDDLHDAGPSTIELLIHLEPQLRRSSITQIRGVHASLGAHLDATIRTGSACSYRPDEPIHWQT